MLIQQSTKQQFKFVGICLHYLTLSIILLHQRRMQSKDQIRKNYDEKAERPGNILQRQTSRTYQIKAFNNWIKAVLIQNQTKKMCKQVEEELDLKKGGDSKLLHVLDIGCGRGQDIAKWKLARVAYMVALDFSDECIKSYEDRWRKVKQPYRLYTICEDFTSKNLYNKIQHSFYDIVSAQLCFHYMFGTVEGVRTGLTTILSNLLVGGAFVATIPDSYTILKKIKQKGTSQSDGSRVYGNQYFSIKFKQTKFSTPYGNEYGFYLEEAVGKKNEDGTIQYTNQWLIELDSLSKILEQHGVEIEETMNFLQYYKKYRDEYKQLFAKFKLVFNPGQSISPELWEIAHLYRVLVCRKKRKGKTINEFNLMERQKSITLQVKNSSNINNTNRNYSNNHNDRNYSRDNYNRSRDNYNRSRDNHHRSKDNHHH